VRQMGAPLPPAMAAQAPQQWTQAWCVCVERVAGGTHLQHGSEDVWEVGLQVELEAPVVEGQFGRGRVAQPEQERLRVLPHTWPEQWQRQRKWQRQWRRHGGDSGAGDGNGAKW